MNISRIFSKALLIGLLGGVCFSMDRANAIDSVLTCNKSGPILIGGVGARKINNDLIITTSSIRYCANGPNGMTAYQFDYFGSQLIATRAYHSNGVVVLFDTAGALRALVYTGLTGNLSAYQFDYQNGVVVGMRAYQADGIVAVFSASGTFVKAINPNTTGPTFTSYPF